MHSLVISLLFSTLAATVFGKLKNTTQEYRLVTQLTPGQTGKSQFGGLYLSAYHTGAGFNDAVLSAKKSGGIIGFLNGTKGTSGSITYQNQVFDLGTPFSWHMTPEPYEQTYAEWEPVTINAAGIDLPGPDSGFFINKSGLQWTTAPNMPPNKGLFGGWLVCDWWHGVPQLFFLFKEDGSNNKPIVPKIPSSCATVDLIPEYI